MERLIPTLKMSLSDDLFKVLEVTINPIFFIKSRRPSAIPEFQIWIELVLGHNELRPRPVPRVTFRFNSACNLGPLKPPPTADYVPPTVESNNFLIYNHFWSGEEGLLQSAYGFDSVRIIPSHWGRAVPEWVARLKKRSGSLKIAFQEKDDVKAAFAFRRTTYVGSPLYNRVNYPASFHVESAELDTENNTYRVLVPQPFSLWTTKPIPRVISLHLHESVSFWYHYPYQLLSSSHDLDRGDLKIFYHNFLMEASFIEDKHEKRGRRVGAGNNLPVGNHQHDLAQTPSASHHLEANQPAERKRNAKSFNCFPRLPFRFEIRRSTPELVAAPRLAEDPPVWTRKNMPMYPAKPADNVEWISVTTEKHELSLVAEIVDTRANTLKELITLAFGLFSSIVISIARLYGKTATWSCAILVALVWTTQVSYFYSRWFRGVLSRLREVVKRS
jgi:hypothetical protein